MIRFDNPAIAGLRSGYRRRASENKVPRSSFSVNSTLLSPSLSPAHYRIPHLPTPILPTPTPAVTMASLFSALSLRAMSLAPRRAIGAVFSPLQALATRTTTPMTVAAAGGPAAMAGLQQQTRGMKVHSAVKKRCEHCKVRYQVIFLRV